MMQRKEVVIDGKNHLLGRLAAIVAKKALEGTDVTVVRCEEMYVSGKQFRNRLKYMAFLRKHSNTNPTKHSHIHYRSPSKIFKRTIRGMLPHKTPRGATALNSVKALEGVPGRLKFVKRMVVPDALKHLRIKPTMPVTRLGDLCSSVGWKSDGIVQKLEATRKARSAVAHEVREAQRQKFREARQNAIESAPEEIKQALALVHDI